MAGDSGARFRGTFHNAIVFNTRHPEILSQHSPPQDDNASRQRLFRGRRSRCHDYFPRSYPHGCDGIPGRTAGGAPHRVEPGQKIE
jgi:hypothetical protein